MMAEDCLNILDLPDIAFEKVFSFLTYDEIAVNRIVCRKFNAVGGRLLTNGFYRVERKHAALYKMIKSLLPRRPSERRSHLAVTRLCEVLQGIETRVRMLGVTYSRYIDQKLICFIPGRVLDEINRLLKLIENRFDPPRNNNQLLEELRDLSSMAMEHFDEYISPSFEKQDKMMFYNNELPLVLPSPQFNHQALSSEIQKVKRKNRIHRHRIIYLAEKVQKMTQKMRKQNIRMRGQSMRIREQSLKLQIQSTKIENHEILLSEMSRKMEELTHSYNELKSNVETNMNLLVAKINSTAAVSESNFKVPLEEPEPIEFKRDEEIRFTSVLSKGDYGRFRNDSLLKTSIRSRKPVWCRGYESFLKPQMDFKAKSRILSKGLWQSHMVLSKQALKPRLSLLANSLNTNSLISVEKKMNLSESIPTSTKSIENKNESSTSDPMASTLKFLQNIELNRKRKVYENEDIPSKIRKNLDAMEVDSGGDMFGIQAKSFEQKPSKFWSNLENSGNEFSNT